MAKAKKRSSKKPTHQSKAKNQPTKPYHRVLDLRSVQIHTCKVKKSDLNNGTRTTPKTRKHVNQPGTFRPDVVQAIYSAGKGAGKLKGRTKFVNRPSKTNDAGHVFPRQCGGQGHIPSGVFPQNPPNRIGVWRTSL